MFFSVGLAAKRLLLPGLVVLVFRPGGQLEIWLMILFVPAVIGALAKYLSFRYRLGPDELIIREGIVTRNERHVPYARIQNIDLVQNPFHRWLNVAEVRVETASGVRPEAIMRVLSLSSVEAMREHVFRQKRAARPSPEEDASAGEEVAQVPAETLVQTSWGDLVLLGLSSHRGLTMVAAAMGVFWQLDPLGDVDEGWVRDRVTSIDPTESLAAPGPVATALLVVGVVLTLVLLLSLLSVIWAALRYHGFTLRECGDDLRSEYGLLTRITATIPRHRIQSLTIRSGPFQRWFGRCAVQIETAGHRGGEEGQGADRLWLAPMIDADKVEGLLHHVLPNVDLASARWRPIALRAWKRIVKRGIALALVSSAGIWALAGAEGAGHFHGGRRAGRRACEAVRQVCAVCDHARGGDLPQWLVVAQGQHRPLRQDPGPGDGGVAVRPLEPDGRSSRRYRGGWTRRPRCRYPLPRRGRCDRDDGASGPRDRPATVPLVGHRPRPRGARPPACL